MKVEYKGFRGVFRQNWSPKDNVSKKLLQEQGEVSCIVLVAINEKGKAYEGGAFDCPDSFKKYALKKVFYYKWERPVWEGEATKALMKIRVKFE